MQTETVVGDEVVEDDAEPTETDLEGLDVAPEEDSVA